MFCAHPQKQRSKPRNRHGDGSIIVGPAVSSRCCQCCLEAPWYTLSVPGTLPRTIVLKFILFFQLVDRDYIPI